MQRTPPSTESRAANTAIDKYLAMVKGIWKDKIDPNRIPANRPRTGISQTIDYDASSYAADVKFFVEKLPVYAGKEMLLLWLLVVL